MAKTDTEQSATVFWFDQIPPPGASEGGSRRYFDRLADAVRFAMQEIPTGVRGAAWIQTDDGPLNIEEVEAIYRDLPTEEKD